MSAMHGETVDKLKNKQLIETIDLDGPLHSHVATSCKQNLCYSINQIQLKKSHEIKRQKKDCDKTTTGKKPEKCQKKGGDIVGTMIVPLWCLIYFCINLRYPHLNLRDRV